MLESAQVPKEQAMVAFVRKGMMGLGTSSIKKVRVCFVNFLLTQI